MESLQQKSGSKGKRAVAYLYDLSLSMLGPEGLRRSGAADGDKAGWLTVQRGSDQLTAGCSNRRRLQTVGLNGGMVPNPWPWEECNTVLLSC